MAFRGALLFALGVAWLSGCGTVDLGPPPADVNACRPSRQFFGRVWNEFLGKEYGGKRCSDARCHDAGSPRQLILTPPMSALAQPLSADWEAVYKSASEQMSCTNVAGSALLTRPSSGTHAGGKLIEPDGPEAALLRMWVAAP